MALPQVFVKVLLVYIVLDTLWVWRVPDALPSCPHVILTHHVATTALVMAPLFRPELAIFACLDGLVEVNTFFLILRRQWKAQARDSRPDNLAVFRRTRLV